MPLKFPSGQGDPGTALIGRRASRPNDDCLSAGQETGSRCCKHDGSCEQLPSRILPCKSYVPSVSQFQPSPGHIHRVQRHLGQLEVCVGPRSLYKTLVHANFDGSSDQFGRL